MLERGLRFSGATNSTINSGATNSTINSSPARKRKTIEGAFACRMLHVFLPLLQYCCSSCVRIRHNLLSDGLAVVWELKLYFYPSAGGLKKEKEKEKKGGVKVHFLDNDVHLQPLLDAGHR